MDQLDDARKERIRNGLQSYRRRVTKLNTSIIHELAKQMLSRPTPPNKTEEEHRKDQMISFHRSSFETYQHHGPLPAEIPSSPQQLFEDSWRDKIFSRWSLDGLRYWDSIDLDKRLSWFEGIRSAIDQSSLIDEPESRPTTMPMDLIYLSTLVNAIIGPGLPAWRFGQQIDMLSSVHELGTDNTVIVFPRSWRDTGPYGGSIVDLLWSEWKKSVGFTIGVAHAFGNAASLAIYCRRYKGDEEHDSDMDGEDFAGEEEGWWKEADYEWRWRYGVCDGDWCSRLFDSVEGLLGWYATCKSPVAGERDMSVQ